MLKFSANLSFLFADVPFLDRFARAAAAGFKGVEYMFPYAFAKEDIAERLRAHGLQQVLFNLPAGDWEGGERGIGCHPERMEEFRAGVELALEYALTLGCRRLNCLAGIAPAGVPEAELRRTFVANLRWAAEKFAPHGIALLAEPINSRVDIPGFWLDRPAKGLEVLAEAGVGQLQYDLYHAQIMEGDLARFLENHLGSIGHLQIADNPGRHEPGTGEIHYPFLFRHLLALGYDGWIGCEYKPATTTEAGLGWLAAAGQA
ncbi:MAG TPA: hydroxypyruvate isomerase [Azospira sp.]|nr:hydroxypyruvate isomerase [Azospira sp.]